jgi:small subunit ribosomal protein S13
MAFVLGRTVQIALTAFYGIGNHTAKLICARLSLHERMQVSQLSEVQINQLSALLSEPSAATVPATPFASPFSSSLSPAPPSPHGAAHVPTTKAQPDDPLTRLVIEQDLRRKVRSNIHHMRSIGTYRGRRHAMGLPVNGQRTSSNAKTAKRLNKVDRRGMVTMAAASPAAGDGPRMCVHFVFFFPCVYVLFFFACSVMRTRC